MSLPESLPESRTRVHLALAGLVAVPQFEVRDDEGRWPARVDLAFPELRVALEVDTGAMDETTARGLLEDPTSPRQR